MVIYILKFSGCLSLFMIFYKLFLEKESFHNLKRFYLFGALLLSVSIPFITFTQYVEIPSIPNTTTELSNFEFVTDVSNNHIIQTSWKDYIPNILWSIYFIGLLVFSFRFVKHLYQMYYRIMNNEKLKDKAFTNVLLLDKINPHTFFKYIFLNKHKYESNAIPKEVLLHEQTHAKQLHAIDIIIIELIQVIFWFNPLLYFIKKDIKLNHEFLADQSVLKVGTEPTNYQQLLLAFSSNACEPQLANAINYSSIKKRLTVMKTQTTKSRTWIKSLLLLPLLAVLIYGFSSEKVEYLYPEPEESIDSIKVSEESLFLVTIEKKENSINLKCISGCRWGDITLDTKAKSFYTINDFGFTDGSTLKTDKYAFKITPTASGINLTGMKGTAWLDLSFSLNKNQKQIINEEGMIDNSIISLKEPKKVDNKVLQIRAIKNNIYLNSIPSSLKSYKTDFDNITKNWSDKDYKSTIPDLKISECSDDFLEKLDTEFRKTKYFSIAIQGVSLSPKESQSTKILNQESASREQMAEYNKLAKHYNKQPESNRIVKLKDLKQLETIYSLMSKKQKQDAEPFPNCPPSPNQESASREQMAEYNKLAKHYNSNLGKEHITIYMKDVKRLEYIYRLMSKKQRKDAESFPDFPEPPPAPEAPQNLKDVPPPPPAPEDPLDHIINMAKKGAEFYLEGKKVSSDKAIEALKRNKGLNISTKNSNTKQPEVYITKKGITIKKETPSPKTGSINTETGNIKINGEKHFYSKRNGITSYFNTSGQQVDKNGKRITNSEIKNPVFYYNGKQISSNKANALLNSNRNIAVTNKNYKDGSYAVILSNVNSNANYNNLNRNVNNNANVNPNSIIDLTKVINEGATFYLNDKPISTKKALELTKSNNDLKVQTITKKDSNPKVYFWSK